jgi:hypothetical protein
MKTLLTVLLIALLASSIAQAGPRPYPWGTITEIEHNQSRGVIYGWWHASQARTAKNCFIPDTLAEFYSEVWPVVSYIMNADYLCLGCLGERGSAAKNTVDVINEIYPCNNSARRH